VRLSVIVVAYNAARTIRASLGALARQTDDDFDALLVDSSTDGTPEIVRAEFPKVTVVRSETRLYPGAARNWGIAEATGNVIAFVDSDCLAAVDWVAQLKAAHAEYDAGAIGGSVAPANPQSVIGWGAYLCEFATWAPAGTIRRMPDIPTCNISYKREALEKYGPFREIGYCSDTALNWKLTAAGDAPLFVPDLRVLHFNHERLGRFLSKQAMHGEAFAAMRRDEQGLPAWRRWAYCAGCSVLPGVLLGRMAMKVIAGGLTKEAAWALPVVVLGLAAWSWGEARGYAANR
jgi:GT2 family glycosyltransferase